MPNIILEDGQPIQPLQWTWIVQRQGTDGKSASIWKFGLVAPDGAEVRVTLHQVSSPTPDQSAPPQSNGTDNGMGSGSGGASSQDVIPAGQPNPDQTGDGVFYATFFSNRNPEMFSKWDTSLSHEDSLSVWVTITHGLVDFLRKAKPKNLILDDLGNGKLKMVLRSVSMDIVATDPEYTLELTKKHEYQSYYQIKKGGTPSAFDQAVSGRENEGDTQPAQPTLPGSEPIKDEGPLSQTGAPNSEKGIAQDDSKDSNPSDTGIAPESKPDSSLSNNGAGNMPNPPNEPVKPKITPSIKGMTLEIGRDYSVAVRDRQNNVVDRFKGKNPLDILRWINVKGYGSNKMKVVDKETPSGTIAKTRDAAGQKDDNQEQTEQFVAIGNKVIVHGTLEAKRAAAMNYVVNANTVRCTMENVEFEFASDKDMNFKQALVELAYKQTHETLSS